MTTDDSSLFFSRSAGPLVSILIPSRGRPEGLMRAIGSLWETCSCPPDLQFIVKMDDDDGGTFDAIGWLHYKYAHLKVEIVKSTRGNGFADINKWLDDMSRIATGDWLFVFTDDAVMETNGWDKIVKLACSSYPWPGINDVCLMVPGVLDNPHGCDFPILRRRTWELLGSWGPIPYADTWVHVILRGIIGCFLCPPITITHTKPDSTSLMGEDARPPLIRYHSPTTNLIWQTLRDAAKLTAHIDACRNLMQWVKSPEPGWHWWRESDSKAGNERLACLDRHGTVTLVKDKGGMITVSEGGNAELTTVGEIGGEWCSIR